MNYHSNKNGNKNMELIDIPNMTNDLKLERLIDEIHDSYAKIAKLAERKASTQFIELLTRHIEKLKNQYSAILNKK